MPPSQLAGGYRVGETVYYAAAGNTWDDGDRVEYGLRGEVMGPNPEVASRLIIEFEGSMGKINVHCFPTQLSRSQPPEEVRIFAFTPAAKLDLARVPYPSRADLSIAIRPTSCVAGCGRLPRRRDGLLPTYRNGGWKGAR